jgi:flavin-binding protein dodecin
MEDHVYKVLELVGSSEKSIEDAIQNAITRASKTLREMKWFEVLQTRGHIENGSVRHYQVTLKVGLLALIAACLVLLCSSLLVLAFS